MKKVFFALAALLISMQINAQNLADLFEEHKESVVTIYVSEAVNPGQGDPRTFTSNMGLGSGVLISETLILTASHVVANAEKIMVQFYDGEAISAKVRRISKIADVALIELTKAPADPHIARLGDSDASRIGEDVFVIGAPMGLPYSLSRGVISGKHSEPNLSDSGKKLEFLQTDASINTGNSGGPMFNYKGEVVGIVSSILTRSGGFEGIGFAATSNVSRDLLTERGSRFFGIEAMVIPHELAMILNVPQESGWLVQHVVHESTAFAIGMKGGYRSAIIDEQEIMLGGDIILQVDDVKITGEESIQILLEYLNDVESSVTHIIKVYRAGEIIELRWVSSSLKPLK